MHKSTIRDMLQGANQTEGEDKNDFDDDSEEKGRAGSDLGTILELIGPLLASSSGGVQN